MAEQTPLRATLSLAALLAGLAAGAAQAQQPERWIEYGVKEADGTRLSWNKDRFQVHAPQVFDVVDRAVFPSPQAIPGAGDHMPLASSAVTVHRVHCPDHTVQPLRAVFLDAAGREIGRIDRPGTTQPADPQGNRIRDRLLASVCRTLANHAIPQKIR